MHGHSSKTIDEYDAVGFDMDLCMARYHLKALVKDSYETVALVLVKDVGYPSEMFPDDEEYEEYFKLFGRCVIDMTNLNVLKVTYDGEVLKAFDGLREMTAEEIKAAYGEKPSIGAQDWSQLYIKDKFYLISDIFKADYLIGMIRIKELLKSKGKYPMLERKTGHDIHLDFRKGVFSNHHHFQGDTYVEPSNFGFFIPMLNVNTKRYVAKTERTFFEKLHELKKAGKIIFIVTNAHVGYFDIVFPFFTQDYPGAIDLFDYVAMHAGKPVFFEKDNRETYKVDYSKKNLKSPHGMDFVENKFLLEGNSKTLTEEFKRKLNKDDVKVLFFGDNMITDMACQATPGWDGAFIFEELTESCPDLSKRADHSDFTTRWGSWLRDRTVDGREVDTLAFHLSKHLVAKTFSRVTSAECLDSLTLKPKPTA